MSIVPPKPTDNGVKDYADALTNRFNPANAAAHADATKAAQELKGAAVKIAALAKLTTTDDSTKKLLEERADQLASVASAANAASELYAKVKGGNEAAAEFMDRALDLQVQKVSGLLAFNAISVAVGTILWTSKDLPEEIHFIGPWLFFALLISSISTLSSVWVAWGSSTDYADAASSLKRTLKLGALRAWALNLSVLLSLGSVVLIAAWIYKGVDKPKDPVSVNVVGTSPTLNLRLRCIIKNRVSTVSDKKQSVHLLDCETVK